MVEAKQRKEQILFGLSTNDYGSFGHGNFGACTHSRIARAEVVWVVR